MWTNTRGIYGRTVYTTANLSDFTIKARKQLKTLQRKVPKSQIASFEKKVVKVFNSHVKHWIKQNVDAQI